MQNTIKSMHEDISN